MHETLQKLHLISHTHWDREWYLPFETLRFRLVTMMDKLLALMEQDTSYRFHLDGQAIVLEDYLELRPENKERIKALVQSGRLAIGPWYVLFDAHLVSAESFIRNFEEGMRICEAFGEPLKLGYMPDTFSHISQMPLIMKQLGMEHAVMWRGLNGTPEETPSEFYWQASSGDRIKTLHLPYLYGYTSAMALPFDPLEAAARLEQLVDTIAPYSLTGQVLLMNGIDHLEPQLHLGEIIKHWNDNHEVKLEQTSFADLMSAIDASDAALPVVQGEFRRTNHMPDSHINQVTPGVLSSRVYLKQQNARVQTWMEKLAEPLEAIMRVLGWGDHPAFVRQAWKYVIQNHPHDSICGCSIDAVHDEMEIRSLKAEQIAKQLVQEAICKLAELADTSWISSEAKPVLFFNPLPWQRGGLVEFEFDADESTNYRSVVLLDQAGNETQAEILTVEKLSPVQPYSAVYPLSKAETNRYRLRAYLSDLPALGYRVMSVRLRQAPPLSIIPLQSARRYIENEWVRITCEADGTLLWLDKQSGAEWRGLHDFEDGGDAGDGYLYSQPIRDAKQFTASVEGVAVTSSGFGWSEMKVTVALQVPAALHANGRARSDDRVLTTITTVITLQPGQRTAAFHTELDNRSNDHRLRVIFPINGKRGAVYAGSQFDVLGREEQVRQPSEAAWLETERTTFPFQQFIYADSVKGRLAFTGEGLHEYEWVSDDNSFGSAEQMQTPELAESAEAGDSYSADGCLAITLFRSVSHLSAADRGMNIRYRPGPLIAAPGSQCRGPLSFDYSLTIEPVGPIVAANADGTASAPWRIADEQTVPVLSVQLPLSGKHADGQPRELDQLPEASQPSERSFLAVPTAGVQVSSIRPLLDGCGFELRLVNLNDKEVRAEVMIAVSVELIETGLANGKRLSVLPTVMDGNGVHIVGVDLAAKNMVTLFVQTS